MELKIGSMFSGIGGIDLAFMQAGFKISWAIEKDTACCKTYRYNFPDNNLIESDIRSLNPEQLSKIDILAAGFPCQSFSVAGKQLGFKDHRGNLFFEIVRFAKALEPKIIFLENVLNLIDHDNGITFNTIHNSLVELGYFLRYKVMRASEYTDIPQIRDRIFIIAFKDIKQCEKFCFPEPYDKMKSIEDTLKRSEQKHPIYYYDKNDSFYNNIASIVKRRDSIYRVYHDSIKIVQNHMCPTLTASMGTQQNQVPIVLDDYGYRKLTLRECLDFQGFPNEFWFPKSVTLNDAYKQVGNTVCVPVIRRLTNSILSIIDDC